jgi:anti-anti-sigma factor
MMSAPLDLRTVRRDDGRLALIAVGEIDLSNVDVFNRAFAAAITDGEVAGGPIVVDLSAVEYLDSAAINVLCARAGLINVVANPLLMSTLKISGLAELVPIEPSLPPPEGEA